MPAASRSTIAAIVPLVAWTVIELIVFWAVGTFRREPAIA